MILILMMNLLKWKLEEINELNIIKFIIIIYIIMNLYLQLFIIFMITYYLFYYREKKTVENYVFNIPDYTQKKLNGYDLNDLSLERPKHYNSLDYGYTMDSKRIKYLKGINDSLNRIRLLVNKDRETTYNIQNRNPTPIEGDPKPFMFVAKYLTDKMNQLSANLYDVTFVKFNKIIGEEIDEQYKVYLGMNFSVKLRKESHSDKNSVYNFSVKSEAVINKANILYGKVGTVFFRTLFIDERLVDEFLPSNLYFK